MVRSAVTDPFQELAGNERTQVVRQVAATPITSDTTKRVKFYS